ncbi:MAG TPA: hypothetical protein VM409_05970 [Chloroflexia bacterium]|nr:hypothetical protein [Chloroflexia bacterium]
MPRTGATDFTRLLLPLLILSVLFVALGGGFRRITRLTKRS